MAPEAGTLVCRLDEIADGGGRLFDFDAGQGVFRLLVLRSGERCFGYVNRCPHFGVPLAERDEHLIVAPHVAVKCNVHYSRFRWQDGYCEDGECPGESLLAVALAVAGGDVRFAA